MRKLICLLALVALVSLNGCAYYASTLFKVKGDDVKGQIGTYNPILGKNVRGIVWRQMVFGTERFIRALREQIMSDVMISEGENNIGSLVITKPKTLEMVDDE